MNLAERLLPESYFDKHDAGALAAAPLAALSAHPTLLFILCILLIAGTLVLVALRSRLNGLQGGTAAVAVAVVALAMSGRIGSGFDPAAWCFLALLLTAADSGKRYRWYLPLIVAVWSVLLDSGTIGAAIVVLHFAGTLVDERAITARTREAGVIAVACVLASFLSATGISFAFSGARALYFDMLMVGADRQPFWSAGAPLAALTVCGIVIIAAAGGIARKNRSGDVCVFLAFLVSAVMDARMIPFFAIAVVPPLLERYESINVPLKVGAVACAASIVAALLSPVTSDAGPAALLAALARDHRPHRVVCLRPAWCNPVLDLRSQGVTALETGIPEASSPGARRLQKRIIDDSAAIVEELQEAHADTLITASSSSGAGLLLTLPGWRVAARETSGNRFVLQREVPL
jgi:hypothetical protein